MKLKLHMDDYLTAIAGVSLLRLQDWACRNLMPWQGLLEKEKPIQPKSDCIEVDSSVLDHLPEWYFKYLMDKHSVAKREKEKFKKDRDYKSQNLEEINFQEEFVQLKDSLSNNLKKLQKYFRDHTNVKELENLYDELKSIKPEQAQQQFESLRDRYLELLATEEFDERLTLNIIRSFLSNSFYGQTSMLQRTRSNYTLEQHIEQMKNDFVEPVKMDVEILQWILEHPHLDTESQKQLVDLFKKAKEHYPSKLWADPIKKMKPEDIHGFLSTKLRCSFEEEWFATLQFEEMVFAPLGISGSLLNFNWEFENHPLPISNWIRLVLFLAPVGLTRFTRLYKDNFETYYCFVFRDGTPLSIYQDNNDLENLEHNETFDKLISKLVQREEYKAKREAQTNIQIVEFNSDIDLRKTEMNYYHIPRHIIAYFEKGLNKIHFINRPLRDTFLKLVMESIDPIMSIWQYIRQVIKGKGNANSTYFALRERLIIEELKKREGKMMPTEDLKRKTRFIYHVSQEGAKIRKELDSRAERQLESTDYASSGSKRAASIAYRLLNAAKAKDKQQFIDTVIRLYLTVNLPVPNSLLNVLHEEDIDFASWSGAFIAGLLGSEQRENSKNDENSD